MATTPWKVTAEEELKKNENFKKDDLLEIKQWMGTQKHLPLIDDELILNFLHACFYNVENAKETIDTCLTYKTTMPAFFSNWDPLDPDLQVIINDVMIAAPLPKLTPEGYKAIVCQLNDTDINKFDYPKCVKWLTMTATVSQWHNGVQLGYVIVYDATGFSISHMLKCSLSHIKNYINFGKNASPIRVVKIVFINTSSVVKKMLALVKPFLNKELINMMSFHTSPDPFFKDFDRSNVPEDYGGTAPPLLSLHREYVKLVTSYREWLIEEEKIKSDENKRISKSKKVKDIEKTESSFQKLEID